MGKQKNSFFGRSRDKTKSKRSQSISDSQSSVSVYSQSNPSPLLAATAARAASKDTNISSESSKTLFVQVPKSSNCLVASSPHERMKVILNSSNHSIISLGDPALSIAEEEHYYKINQNSLYHKDAGQHHDEVEKPSKAVTSALAQYEEMLQASRRPLASAPEDGIPIPTTMEENSQEGLLSNSNMNSNSLPLKTEKILVEEMKPKAIDAIIDEMNLIQLINTPNDFHMVRELLSVLLLVMEEGHNDDSINSIDPIAVFFSVKRISRICLLAWLRWEKDGKGACEDHPNDDTRLIKESFFEVQGGLEEANTIGHLDDHPIHSSDLDSPKSRSQNSDTSKIDVLNIGEYEWDKVEEIWWDIAEKSMCVVELVTVAFIGPLWQMQIRSSMERIFRSRQNDESLRYDVLMTMGWDVRHIPENIPLEILIFASEFGNLILPPTKNPNSLITLIRDDYRSHDDINKNDEHSIKLKDFSKCRKKRIWEEQRWLIRRQRFSGYQRNLTSALCVESDENSINQSESNTELSGMSRLSSVVSPKGVSYPWSVPCAHGHISNMIRNWLHTALVGWPSDPGVDENESLECKSYEFLNSNSISLNWSTIVRNGAIDWWFIFQVSKSISDLVKAGWRPPPSNIDDGECIIGLLEIASAGVVLDSSSMKFATDDSQDDAREERIVAVSAAFDALEALQQLVRRGYLPEGVVSCTTCTLCYLLIVLDPSKSKSIDFDLFPVPSPQSSDQQDEIENEIETFIDQRDACVSEIAELLWSMVALNSTMDTSVDAALSLLRNLDLSRLNAGIHQRDCTFEKDILSACGAVRSLGASIWGNPPEIKGIDSLRSCWSIFLDTLSEVSSHGFERPKPIRNLSNNLLKPTLTPVCISNRNSIKDDISDETVRCIPQILGIESYDTSYLALIFEITIAVKRFVKGQILNGTDNLSLTEWESFLALLEFSFLPWLAYSYSKKRESGDRRQGNSHSLVDRKTLLSDGIQAEVDEMFRDMELFFSCSSEGVLIHQRISDEGIRRRFHLLYLQHVAPLLCTEGADSICIPIIKSWVCGGPNSHNSQEWLFKCSDLLSNIFAVYEDRNYGHSGYVHSFLVREVALKAFVNTEDDGFNDDDLGSLSSSFRKSSTMDRSTLNRFTKNIHGSVICKAMIPFLSEVILVEESRKGISIPNSTAKSRILSEVDDNKQSKLLLSAIKIVGDLLLSSHLEVRDRDCLIKLLKSCVLDKSLSKQLSVRSSEGLLANTLHLNDWGKWVAIKLGAIKQLSLYLRACMSYLPNLHSFVPEILSVFYDTIRLFLDYDVACSIAHSKLVSFAAFYQVSCLQCDENGRIIMIDETHLMNLVPFNLAMALDKVRLVMDSLSVNQVWIDSSMFLDYNFHVIDTIRNNYQSSSVYFKQFKKRDDESDRHSHVLTFLSLEELLSLIKDVATKNNDDVSASFDKNCHITNFIFSSQESASGALRELSLESLRLHILSGVVQDPVGCWISLSSCSNHVGSSISLIRLQSMVAGFLVSYEDIQASKKAFTSILESCIQSNIESLQVSCEGILCALSAVRCTTDDDEHTFGWLQDACRIILQQLRPIVDNVTGYSYEVNNSPVTTLLTTLYGALLMYSPKRDRLSGRIKGDIIIVCHDICSNISSSAVETQIYLLAVCCASVAVASIDMNDLCNVIGLISKRRPSISHNEKKNVRHTIEFADVIFDLLVQKCLFYASANASESRPSLRISRFEIVAKDVEDIEAFRTNETDDKHVGAWLCNKMLIVCRVASSDSRYRGYVEVTLRSPTTRVRRLIRLTDPLSLDNPEFPSNLWNVNLPISNYFDNQKLTVNVAVQDNLDIYNSAKSTLQYYDRYTRQHFNEFGARKKGFGFEYIDSFEDFGYPTPEALSQTKLRNTGSCFGNFLSVALNGNEMDIKAVEEVLHELDGSTYLLDPIYSISDEPKQLKWGPKIRRAVNILDRTAFLQTHKIALLLAGPHTESSRGETKEVQDDWILNVKSVTPLFSKFSSGLGSFTSTTHLRIYSGGIDTSSYGADGSFALVWLSGEQNREGSPYIGETMVLFHSVPLMPPGVNNRKRHVGNDVVHVIFCENSNSDEYTRNNIISGEFCFVTIFVTPISSNNFARVTLKIREDLPEDIKGSLDYLSSCVIVPFEASAAYTRELAIRADIACRSLIQDRLGLVSNWQERLQQINNLDRYAIVGI